MDDGAGQHLLVIFDGVVAFFLGEAVVGIDRLGGIDAGAVQGQQGNDRRIRSSFPGPCRAGLY